ncbi:hypothetical protein JQX13_44085 [Archangium violaceum]|uniref:hypothetical protein n=1 Tax=Archangium violaceum TaxID=83451 RepID=UPI00193B5AB1|nr:hypothetical protein [Archangium violaceum]QRK06971.1 hypothetical protein JQX13_44085 [Archangium violaceum]
MGTLSAVSPNGQPPLEQRIRERIRSFDIPALLEQLARMGYRAADIEYRSQRTNVHQGHLVHDIQFLPPPNRRAVITVNVGLLSVQSLLPSFLLQALERQDNDRMELFLGYFDHLLLHARFAGLHPERDASLLPGWGETARHRLLLLRPNSPSTLHWLFSSVYPEAEISVRRELRRQQVPSTNLRLGTTTLGDTTSMGGFAYVPTGGMEVSIHCDEPWCGTGVPWSKEAPRRLFTRILPLLSERSLLLTTVLVLRDYESYARIEDDSYVGYDPLVFGEDVRHVVLFSDDTARYKPVDPNEPGPEIRRAG